MGLGIIGFPFVFYLFQGDRYAAPPWALALISFCFALVIGAAAGFLWLEERDTTLSAGIDEFVAHNRRLYRR